MKSFLFTLVLFIFGFGSGSSMAESLKAVALKTQECLAKFGGMNSINDELSLSSCLVRLPFEVSGEISVLKKFDYSHLIGRVPETDLIVFAELIPPMIPPQINVGDCLRIKGMRVSSGKNGAELRVTSTYESEPSECASKEVPRIEGKRKR